MHLGGRTRLSIHQTDLCMGVCMWAVSVHVEEVREPTSHPPFPAWACEQLRDWA